MNCHQLFARRCVGSFERRKKQWLVNGCIWMPSTVLFSFGPSKRSQKSWRWKFVSVLPLTPRIQTDVDDKKVRYHGLTFTTLEMSPAIVSGIVTGDAPVSYWPMFSPSQVTDPKIFAKVNSPHSEVANRDLKIWGRQRQRKGRKKVNSRSFMQSSSRLLQVTNFAKCRRTLLKLKS